MEGLSEKLTDLLISAKTQGAEGDIDYEINIFIGALNDAIERVLGAPQGSINLIDPDMLKVWLEGLSVA